MRYGDEFIYFINILHDKYKQNETGFFIQNETREFRL